jgi:hypothetical protein
VSHTTGFGKLGWVIHNGDWSGDAEVWLADATGDDLLRMATRPPGMFVLPAPAVLAMSLAIAQQAILLAADKDAPEEVALVEELFRRIARKYEPGARPPQAGADIPSCGCEREPHTCSEDDYEPSQTGGVEPTITGGTFAHATAVEPVYEPLMPEKSASATEIEWREYIGGPPRPPVTTGGGFGALFAIAAARLHDYAAHWASSVRVAPPPPGTREAVSAALEIVANVLRDLAGEPGGPVIPVTRDALLLLTVEGLLLLLAFPVCTSKIARRAVLDGEVYIDGFLVTDPEAPLNGVFKETFVVRFRGETRIVQVF